MLRLLRVSVGVADPVADDADEDQDHAGQNDEMGGVLGEREARDAPVVDMGDEVVLHEVEQEAEDHHDDAEPGKTRERRAVVRSPIQA